MPAKGKKEQNVTVPLSGVITLQASIDRLKASNPQQTHYLQGIIYACETLGLPIQK